MNWGRALGRGQVPAWALLHWALGLAGWAQAAKARKHWKAIGMDNIHDWLLSSTLGQPTSSLNLLAHVDSRETGLQRKPGETQGSPPHTLWADSEWAPGHCQHSYHSHPSNLN